MKIRGILAATAVSITSFAPVMVTPALAVPIVDTTGMDPQEACEAYLRPNDPNSEFQTAPTDVVPGTPVNVGDPTPVAPLGPEEGYGTPVYSNVFLTSGYYRNGGSPNVWGGATARATYPQTRQLWSFEQDVETTTTFGCAVWKTVGNGEDIYPPGLQLTGLSVVDEDTIPAPDDYIISEDDFIVDDVPVNMLICISPNNVTKGKPGTWTGKNGFPAANCPAASLAAIPPSGAIPSLNAPDMP